ncbi:MAG: NAD(P)H-dependent oxidoreductase subunit E, partial [Planctomycetes bacterium]|nr:NAD(P)H-dependent oxidoreductase subunit E [Planctomycetota bacterium]
MKIVQRLREIQDHHGYLPDVELAKLARDTGTPLYRLQEVASFFFHFRQEWDKPPDIEIKVCRDMSCHLAQAADLLHADTGLKRFEATKNLRVEVTGTSCLGRCDRAPAVCISRHDHKNHANSFHDRVYAGLKPKDLDETVEEIIRGENPPPRDTPDLRLDISIAYWQINPYETDPALASQPYAVTKKYLSEFPNPVTIPDDVKKDPKKVPEFIKNSHPWLAKLDAAGLLGMGGAGVKAFEKWRDLWIQAPGLKYIVCNGDESEPSTFKDRELLLRTPHLIVEGVILAGLITGATKGYIYIRHEYLEQIEAVTQAILEAREEGVCGTKILGGSRSFDVEVFVSPGGYICGEQSALIEAMEDKRGQPRNKPPELLTNGLDDKPTVVNNVETLAWVPAIMHHGGEWYAKSGKTNCKGRRFFSICGDL